MANSNPPIIVYCGPIGINELDYRYTENDFCQNDIQIYNSEIIITYFIQDAWSDVEGRLILDREQNCDNFAWKRRNNVTKFTYTRKFDTCDENDYVIEVKKEKKKKIIINSSCLTRLRKKKKKRIKIYSRNDL